jgi:hypothetical protein
VSLKKFQKYTSGASTLCQLVEDIFKNCDDEETCFFVRLARRLWFRRNEVVHCGSFTHPNSIVQQTLMLHVEFFKANTQATVLHEKEIIPSWVAPHLGA